MGNTSTGNASAVGLFGALAVVSRHTAYEFVLPELAPTRVDGRAEPRAELLTKVERERFAVSLWLVGWLALNLDDRPDPLHIEIGDGFGCVPEVDAGYLAIT